MWNEKSLHDFALQIERLARFFRFFAPLEMLSLLPLQWHANFTVTSRVLGRATSERSIRGRTNLSSFAALAHTAVPRSGVAQNDPDQRD